MNAPGTPRTALILGGAGFVGSHLAENFLLHGWRVVCADDLSRGRKENLALCMPNPNFRFAEADFMAADSFLQNDRFDYIVFAACSVPGAAATPAARALAEMRLQSHGVERALSWSKEHGAVFLYLSDASVYGDVAAESFAEDAPLLRGILGRADGALAEAKRHGEALATTYGRAHGVEVRIARLFELYGPRMAADAPTALGRWFAAAREGKELVVEGAERPYALCHIEDAADAVTRLLRANFTKPLNVGWPSPVPQGEIAGRVAALAPKHPGVAERRPPLGQKELPVSRIPNIEAARRALGWEPKIAPAEGLASLFPPFAVKPSSA